MGINVDKCNFDKPMQYVPEVENDIDNTFNVVTGLRISFTEAPTSG